MAIASDPQAGQSSVSLPTEVPQCRHSYTTSGCCVQDSNRSTRSNSIEGESLWVYDVPAFGALGVYCWPCLCFVFKDHVGCRDLGLAERACTERWWIRRGHGLVEAVCGKEGARVTCNRVVVCPLPLFPVSSLGLYIGEPTTVKLKLEIRWLVCQRTIWCDRYYLVEHLVGQRLSAGLLIQFLIGVVLHELSIPSCVLILLPTHEYRSGRLRGILRPRRRLANSRALDLPTVG